MLRSATLGALLRKEYGNFLSDNYINNQVYAYAAEPDLSEPSTKSLLAGLYVNSTNLAWDIKMADKQLYLFLLPFKFEMYFYIISHLLLLLPK